MKQPTKRYIHASLPLWAILTACSSGAVSTAVSKVGQACSDSLPCAADLQCNAESSVCEADSCSCGAECDELCDDGSNCQNHGDCIGGVCTDGACTQPACDDDVRNGTETDTDCGGTTCASCPQGGDCTVNGDCTTGACAANLCAPGTCANQQLDTGESDIDCGGVDCPPCDVDAGCAQDGDCSSGRCDGSACLAPACDDGVKNGTESGVDCGGSCDPCAVNETCSSGADCSDGVCSATGCTGMPLCCQAATCVDGIQNGNETDVDCGGTCLLCLGATCQSGDACESGVCDNAGVCGLGCSADPDPAAYCAPQICVGAVCQTPCSLQAPNGWCPGTGSVCVDGGCGQPCAGDADCDNIADSEENIPACSGQAGVSQCEAQSTCEWVAEGCWVDTDGNGAPDFHDRDADGDGVPDNVEAGDLDPGTAAPDTDGDGLPDHRDLDSDDDHLSDRYEAGNNPRTPLDSDGDGIADFRDVDSDGDGIDDACEAADGVGGLCSAVGIIDVDQGPGAVADTDGDGRPDFRDTDSDGDGVSDAIEARAKPNLADSTDPLGVDHDGDGIPDYRDADSDNDGVQDFDEDANGDGVVNCQRDGGGTVVDDDNLTPTCGDTQSPFTAENPYDYNPGCPAQKCILAETSRVHADSDGDGIADGADGVFLVCSTANLKPINVFYSQAADYALALERSFTSTTPLERGSPASDAGFVFEDPSVGVNGSWGVAGFLLERRPDLGVMTTVPTDPARVLIEKSLAQEIIDRSNLTAAQDVTGLALVINRNFDSFDGYGAVVSRYRISTAVSVSVSELRDHLAAALDGSVSGYSFASAGPTDTEFTLVTQTLYRHDNGTDDGRVVVVAALSRAGLSRSDADSYAYRHTCGSGGSSYVAVGDTWNYLKGTVNPAADWNTVGFDDTTWLSGRTGIGYGDGDDATVLSDMSGNYVTVYLRHEFSLNDVGTSLAFSVDYDDGFIAYLNGVEIHRENMAVTSFDNTTRATSSHEAGSPELFDLSSFVGDLNVGTNVLAIELHNRSSTSSDASMAPALAGDGSRDVACGNGCIEGAGECTPDPAYQIPLFFVDNITSGSALTQFGDGLASLCQSFNQQSSEVDFMWVVDHSGSMQDEIRQVQTSATLFFNLMANTDADYRVGQVSSHPSTRATWPRTLDFTLEPPRLTPTGRGAGLLYGDFTGTVGGINDATTLLNRSVRYDCADGCSNGETDCCPCCSDPNCADDDPATAGKQIDDPSCYFAAKLPPYAGGAAHGDESAVQMGEWGLYRAGAPVLCDGLSDVNCAQIASCIYVNGVCMAGYCALSGADNNEEQCNGNDPGEIPAGADDIEDELEPVSCEWNAAETACWPSVGVPCGGVVVEADCDAEGPRCQWHAGTGTCIPQLEHGQVLCSAPTQAECEARDGSGAEPVEGLPHVEVFGLCRWDGTKCSANPAKAIRRDATKIVVLLTDEEECYLKDADTSGSCGSVFDIMASDSPLRAARTGPYTGFYNSRGVTVFGITGDKDVGCVANGNSAQPCNAVVDVSEATGGGWGSICAADLYPTIEAIVIGSLGKASRYRLEGFVDGKSVQPIASTIRVAVEVCDVAAEYPYCRMDDAFLAGSGTHMEVVPRSRESGFDYDPITNALVLYGLGRPARGGNIVASYRYWVDSTQPPEGNPACPCPSTTAPDCACPAGEACGIVDGTDNCAALSPSPCDSAPGCAWNTTTGACTATGVCEPDPGCGGGCTIGEVCDPESGLCVCDPTCSPGCGAGSVCDGAPGPTCGQCLCDDTCGGGCAQGTTCQSGAGPTCGQCICDTTCGGSCPANHECNDDPSTATCGSCLPVTCAPGSTDPSCCPDVDGDGHNVCAGDCIDSWAAFRAAYDTLGIYATCPPDPADEIVGYRPQDIHPGADESFNALCDDGVDQNCDAIDPTCGVPCTDGCECGGQACVNGSCGTCESAADCCDPFMCFSGYCVLF